MFHLIQKAIFSLRQALVLLTLTPETSKTMTEENYDISFSGLDLNIRSLNKNFESLKNLLVELNFCFKFS